METHAERFSKGYAARKGFTFWEKDFDAMALKTMLRQLISKWGIMSIEMQEAYSKDMAAINPDGTCDYGDNDSSNIIIPQEEPSNAEEASADNSQQVDIDEI